MPQRTPLFVNSSGDLQRMQAGDTIPMSMGGVGQVINGNQSLMSGNAQIPYDSSLPLISEGQPLWSASVTPTLLTSSFEIEFTGFVDTSKINNVVTVAIFRDSTYIGHTCAASSGYNGAFPSPFAIKLIDTPNVLTPVVYSARIGVNGSNVTWYLNRGAAQTQGGSNKSGWSIKEEI